MDENIFGFLIFTMLMTFVFGGIYICDTTSDPYTIEYVTYTSTVIDKHMDHNYISDGKSVVWYSNYYLVLDGGPRRTERVSSDTYNKCNIGSEYTYTESHRVYNNS